MNTWEDIYVLSSSTIIDPSTFCKFSNLQNLNKIKFIVSRKLLKVSQIRQISTRDLLMYTWTNTSYKPVNIELKALKIVSGM